MNTKKLLFAALLLVAAALIAATGASAAIPQNTAAPIVSGTAREGQTLTTSDGSWANTPTSFSYQWQRCASDGTVCGDITGATSKTYVLASSEVGHTVRVVVTASNTDGKASADSAATDVVDSKNGPTNTVKPNPSGAAVAGNTLAVGTGTWTPVPTSVTRQWQRCGADGTGCLNIAGATGRTYTIRTGDVGHRLRALVTAHTSGGQATVPSTMTAVVRVNTTTTTVTTTQTTTATTTTTVTTPAPKVPTIAFVSLRRVRNTIYARFRVCDQQGGRIRITERDQKARALPYTRHLAVSVFTCGTFTKHWLLLSRYRSAGRLLVTLRAEDSSGRLSKLASRSIAIR